MASSVERRQLLEDQLFEEKRFREGEIDAVFEMVNEVKAHNRMLIDCFVQAIAGVEHKQSYVDRLADEIQEIEHQTVFQANELTDQLEDEIRQLTRDYDIALERLDRDGQ